MRPLFSTSSSLVLASGSPRRRKLLAGLGLVFAVHPALGPEPDFLPGMDPMIYAQSAAVAKAREVARLHAKAAVLAADTIVVVDGDVLGKPRDAAEAVVMLLRLAGREHQVITGCCLRVEASGTDNGDEDLFAVSTRVWMADFGPKALAAYAATGEPLDKAGAYGIQERAAFFVERIEGSYTNVVGLPLSETTGLLLRRGIIGLAGC